MIDGKRSMDDTIQKVVEVCGLSKCVDNGGEPLTILHENSFVVAAGETVAIVGASGSGKSTLLGLLAGLDLPTSGSVKLAGEPLGALDEDGRAVLRGRLLGFVFQSFQLLPSLNAIENVMLPLELAGTPNARREAEFWLDRVGLAHRLRTYPKHLSGGEQQRVGIARALLTSPRLLLLDEPLASLDLKRKQEVLPYLERLHQELEIPIVYVSHSPDEVARLADHLVLLDGGRVRAHGPAAQLMARLDLARGHGDGAGVLLEGHVGAIDTDDHLLHLRFAGGELLCVHGPDAPPRALGQPVRVRVLARDVSLALSPAQDTSILNVLPATVQALTEDGPAQVLVALDLNGSTLLARITRKSAAALQVRPGLRVFAQVKGAAVLD